MSSGDEFAKLLRPYAGRWRVVAVSGEPFTVVVVVSVESSGFCAVGGWNWRRSSGKAITEISFGLFCRLFGN